RAGGPARVAPHDAGATRPLNELLASINLTHPGGLERWLNTPVSGAAQKLPQLTQLSLMVHEVREDVRAAFPDPLGDDQTAFARWFVTFGAAEFRLHRSLIDPVLRSFPLRLQVRLTASRVRKRLKRASNGKV
ncbi:MAG: hypothetical protein QOJ39_1566, partial [Candidatus Eremiobacteraeota bacterium]|nr:hypothetical protein [Candidatus Eremiobacteraeota bacterium]